MTEFRQFVVLAILTMAMVAVAVGMWRFGPAPGQPGGSLAPESVAEARDTAVPLDIADVRETPALLVPAGEAAAWLVEGGGRLGLLAVQLLLVLGIMNLVWQFGRWALARPPLGEVAAPALGVIAIVAMAGAFAMLGPVAAGWIADTVTYVASGRQLSATVAAGEGILPSAAMASWVERLAAWVGLVEANPASWAYLGCSFVSVVVLGTVLGVSVVMHAELFVVSAFGVVVLSVEDLNARAARQDAFADPADGDAAPLPVLGSGGGTSSDSAKRFVTSVLGKGVKLMTLLLAVGVTGHVSREIGEAAGAGTLEDALSVVLLQVACAIVILVLPAALERRVVLGIGS